jgi:hypothetical protein
MLAGSGGERGKYCMMSHYVRMLLLCLALLWGNMACAPVKPVGPTTPSGYFFSLRVSDTQLFLVLPGFSFAHLPREAEVIVQVQNAQGQPVDGVAVEFSVTGTQIATVTPQRVFTRSGQARAVLTPSITGVARVVARVEGMQQEVRITVASGPSNPSSP